MTRWILDVLRLLVFCGVFLLAATTLLAGEGEGEGQSRSFGLKIEIEDGEIKVEQTGDTDLEELPAIIESKIAQIVEQIAENGEIQVRAKALIEDGSKALKDLPIGEMLDAIGNEIDRSKRQQREENIEVEVHVEANEDASEKLPRAIFIASDREGNEDIMEVIKGLKQKIGGQAATEAWVDALGDAGDGPVQLRIRQIGGQERATHRLGVTISGPAGFAVGNVSENSAADDAGIESGDIIVSVDGDRLENVGDLIGMVSEAGQEGDKIRLVIVRDGETINISVSPEEIEGVDEGEAKDREHDSDELGDRERRKAKEGRRRDRDRVMAEAKRRHQQAHDEAVDHAKRIAERAMREAKVHRQKAVAIAGNAVERAAEQQANAVREALRAAAKDHDAALDELREQMAELRAVVEELRSELVDE